MAASGPRRGRRDNGLVAAEYAVVGDVDPRVGEHLLDVLGASGIAAYLQPAADLHPVTRTTTLPPRPTDRLYADREHLDTARGFLAQLEAEAAADEPAAEEPAARQPGTNLPDSAASGIALPDGAASAAAGASPPGRGPDPGEDGTDIDTVFANIIAGYHITADPAARSWPAAEELGPETGVPRRRRTDRQPPASDERDRPGPTEPSLLDGLDTFGAGLPDDEDEGYTPPPPPPLPRISRAATLALIAIAGGLVLFFWPSVLPIQQNMSLLLGFSAVLGGFITLVWRLRPGDEEDDDPDDGARV